MSDFNSFIVTLRSDLIKLARDFGDDVKDDLIADGKAFAEEAKQDLEKWTRQMAEGELTRVDLEWLIKGKKDLARMEALKQKGIAKAKIDEYRNAMLNTVVGSVVKLV